MARDKFKIGDWVSVINDTLTGKIVAIDRKIISIACNDGFLYDFFAIELVLSKQWNPEVSDDFRSIEKELTSVNPAALRTKKGDFVEEIDLHIHELIDSEIGMTAHDKLSLQLKTAQEALESAIQKKQQRIIFIHGRGDGVLRKELRFLLNTYPVAYHDASYSQYGIGATEVIIFQNKK